MYEGMELMAVQAGPLVQNVDFDLGVIRREAVLLVVSASVAALFKLSDQPVIAGDTNALDVGPGQTLELPIEANGALHAHGFTAVAAGGHISVAIFRRRFASAVDQAPL